MFIITYTVAWLASVAVAALILAFLWALGRLQQQGAPAVEDPAGSGVQLGASMVDLGIPCLAELACPAGGPPDSRTVLLLLFPGTPEAADPILRWTLPRLRENALPLRLRVFFCEDGELTPELRRVLREGEWSAGHPELSALTPQGQPVVFVLDPQGLLCARGILRSIRTLDALLSFPSVPWTANPVPSHSPLSSVPRPSAGRQVERSPAPARPVRSSHAV